jgi:enoyl-[acyl-carrier protein] reductase I
MSLHFRYEQLGNFLQDRHILVMGVRNRWSLARHIAEQAVWHGATIHYTYLGEKDLRALKRLTGEPEGTHFFQCDVSSDADIVRTFAELKEKVGTLHGVVHSVAFANQEDMGKPFIECSRNGFAQALDISAYSLIPVAREARKIMVEGGGIISLTYHGSVKVVQNYNLMGVAKAALESITRYLASELGPERIRVNAISAGPVKTASAQGVKDFSQILKTIEDKSPLRRNIDGVDVGKVGLFYLSELSSGITGEITYVDSGYNIMGL